MTHDPRVHLFRAHRARLGEGVLWHPVRRTLLWLDIEAHQILETGVEDEGIHVLDVGSLVGTIAPTEDGQLLAALHQGVCFIHTETGQQGPRNRPLSYDPERVRFNDGKCDAAGRFWVGTLSLTGAPAEGRLYRFDPDGTWQVMREPVSLSNGLAWSPDGATLYYIDTPTRQVQAFTFDHNHGSLREHRVAVDLHDQPGFPDGCTIDVEGRLWIAHWGGGRVTCWDPLRGRLLDTLHLPASQVTSCTFGGPELDRLYITTAATGLSAAQQAAEPEAGYLFCAEVGTRGVTAHPFGRGATQQAD